MLASVAFEMNLNREKIDVTVYSHLDWLSNIGGLYVTLFIILTLVFYLCQLHSYEHNLVAHLFKSDASQLRRNKRPTHEEELDMFKYAEGNPLDPQSLTLLEQII